MQRLMNHKLLLLALCAVALALLLPGSLGTVDRALAADSSKAGSLRNNDNIARIQQLPGWPQDSFSFVVIGDNRDGDATFARLVEQINALAARQDGTQPLFVLHSGDSVAHGTNAEWDDFAKLRAKLKLPIVFVRGNHELRAAAGAENFSRRVGETDWSFDFRGCRFVGIDNSAGKFPQASRDFLRLYLGLNAKGQTTEFTPEHTFVMFHMPLAIGRWKAHCMFEDKDGAGGGEVLEMLKAGQVDAMYLGHIHLYDTMEIEGIPFYISGGGGAPLYGKYGFGTVEHGFMLVHASRDGIRQDWIALEDAPAA